MQSFETIEDTFAMLEDWEDRYAYLIDLGRGLPDFPEAEKTDQRIVPGCTSRVWMILDQTPDNRLQIQADSDAHIVRGLIALVISVFHGQPIQNAAQIDMQERFDRLGLSDHLSPNRRNGFFAMVGKIQAFATEG